MDNYTAHMVHAKNCIFIQIRISKASNKFFDPDYILLKPYPLNEDVDDSPSFELVKISHEIVHDV